MGSLGSVASESPEELVHSSGSSLESSSWVARLTPRKQAPDDIALKNRPGDKGPDIVVLIDQNNDVCTCTSTCTCLLTFNDRSKNYTWPVMDHH